MIHTKFFVNAIYLIIQKIDNEIYVYIEKKYPNV